MIQVICCSSVLSTPGRARAFSRDFTTILAPECRAFSGVLKIEKLKAPLFPAPRGPWIQVTGALKLNILMINGQLLYLLYTFPHIMTVGLVMTWSLSTVILHTR